MKKGTKLKRTILVMTTLALASCSAPQPDRDHQEKTHSISDNAYRFRHATNAIQGKYIVVMNQTAAFRSLAVDNEVQTLAAEVDATVTHTYRYALQGFAANMSESQALALSQDPRVKFVIEDGVKYAIGTQTNATWGLDRIDQSSLPLNHTYTYNTDGSGVTAYIIDTGIRITHNDFGSRASYGYTAINDGYDANDCHGHGTHVSGTVGGSTWGVAKNVNLVAVRVLDCQGSGSDSGVIAGVDWVAQNAQLPAVANMSLGGGASSALDNAVQGAINAGVTFAVAAGNETQNACNVSPARLAAAITVGSTTSSDSASSFSNYGSCVDIYAPGSSITSCSNSSNTATATYSGTSMASPHVTGVAALYLDAYPNASPAAVAEALVDNATSGVISGTNGSPNKLLYTGFIGGVPDPCNGETAQGRCDGNTAIWCEDEQVESQNCAAQGLICGYDSTLGRYGCIEDETDPCNGETDQGRCDGNTAIWCEDGQVENRNCSAEGLVCGYDNALGRYSCIDDSTPPDVIDLNNGQVVPNLSATQGNWLHYRIKVPAGATNLVMQISGGSGDADLYTKYAEQPSASNYDCRPYRYGNTESCSVTTPQAGFYYISLNAYSSFSGVSLKASFVEPNPGDDIPELSNGQIVSGLSATTGNWIDFKIFVPMGATNLSFNIAGGSGDADLYVRIDEQPTSSAYDCRPYRWGNTESCTSSSPREGWYYIGINAYSTFSGVSLQASFD